jgi:integration host factor subunit alpha
MTKLILAEKIHTSSGFSKKESADILEVAFTIIKNTLESGEKLKITGFGNLLPRRTTARDGTLRQENR